MTLPVPDAILAAGRGRRDARLIRANAADATINKWIDEFQPSTLSRDAQIEELTWFQAAEPFKGMDIKVVSETIDTHVYEVADAGQGLLRDHGHQPDP